MNTPLILKISAALLMCGLHTSNGANDGQREEKRAVKEVASSASASISSKQEGEEGTVTYTEKEVWKGKIKKQLSTIAKSIDGENYAAAWDGKKLVWESVKGAGEKLKPELLELLKKQKKLLN